MAAPNHVPLDVPYLFRQMGHADQSMALLDVMLAPMRHVGVIVFKKESSVMTATTCLVKHHEANFVSLTSILLPRVRAITVHQRIDYLR